MKEGSAPDASFEYNKGSISGTSFESISEEREFVEKVKDKAFYTGIFVEKEELYSKFPAQLKNSVENPHITINFAPNETQLHLEELGSEARVFAVGYGNNGKNEGLLVKVESENPIINKAIKDIKVPHITLSYSDDSHPMYTSGLTFSPFERPVELSGYNSYCIHLKDGKDGVTGPLVNSIEELKKHI